MRRVNRRVIEALLKCGAFDSTGTGRAKMFAALDEALERGARFQKEKEQGQTNLFMVLEETAEPVPIRWPDVPEWRENLRLAYEKESLGFYITGHPLARYEKELASLTNANSEKIKDLPDRTPIRIGGVVVNVQLKITKKGDRMAFLTLEDLSGMVDVIVFPDLYQTCQEHLETDMAILVSGDLTVDEKGGSVATKIKAKEIVPLESALEKLARCVVFSITTTGLERTDLFKLKTIVEGYRGQTPAVIKLKVPGRGTAVFRLESGVRPTRNMLREAREAFGDAAIHLNYS